MTCRRTLNALLPICFLVCLISPSLAQSLQPAGPSSSDVHQKTSAHEPAFDRLELLGLVFGTFSSQYVINEIGERGLSFAPDDEFLDAVQRLNRGPGIPEAVAVKGENAPANNNAVSSRRDAAYHLLLKVAHAPGKGDYSSADQDFQDALKLAPDSATLHLAFAQHLLLAQKYSQAEDESRRSLQFWSDDAEGHVVLASSLVGESRTDEAVPEAREALRLFPKHKGALVVLGIALTRNGQYSDAIPVLREAISRTPEMPAIYKDLGVSLLHLKDTDGAVKELTLYSQKNPYDAEGRYYLGLALRAQGHQDEAEAQLKEAARLAPNNPLFASPSGTNAEWNAADAAALKPDLGSVSGNLYANQFFGFTYEFPQHWTVLGADAAKAAAQLGGEMLANGDAILQDAQRTALTNTYPLLFVREGFTNEGAISLRSVQIQAISSHVVPNTSASGILASLAAFLKQVGKAVQPVGAPVEFQAGGKLFERLNVNVNLGPSIVSGAHVVSLQKGYILVFVFMAPDPSSRDELVRTMQSLHFFETAADPPRP